MTLSSAPLHQAWVQRCLGWLLAIISAVLSLPGFGQTPTSSDLLYRFHVQPESEPVLSVEVRFDGGPAGFSVLGVCLSQWPDLEECGNAITRLRVRSERQGTDRHVELVEPNIWICDHERGERLIATYELKPTVALRSDRQFAPWIGSDSISFIADTALLVPEHLVSAGEVGIRYEWSGTKPSGWTALSSFGMEDRAVSARLSLTSFLTSFFFFGPAHVQKAELSSERPLYVAWLGSGSEPSGDTLKPARLLALRRALARYLATEIDQVGTLFVLPLEEPPVSAVALHESVLFFKPPDAVSRAPDRAVKDTLSVAHELVHTSRRFRVDLAAGPLPMTFLSEAAAEFFARRALYRAGLISTEEWATVISDKLAEYARWWDPEGAVREDAEADPYVLGDLALVRIDRELARRSEGQSGAGDFWTPLREKVEEHGDGVLPWNEVLETLAGLTSASFAEAMDEVLGLRRRLRFPQGSFGGCFRLRERPLRNFDPGFEVRRSVHEGRLLGVEEGGAAWRAGLREGQELLEWSVLHGRSHIPVRVVISQGGKRRSYSFLPEGERKLGSRQVLVPVDGDDCGAVLGPPTGMAVGP